MHLTQEWLWQSEVFQDSRHDHMIETGHQQTAVVTQLRLHRFPRVDVVLDRIIQSHAFRNLSGSIVEEGRLQTASQIANARIGTNVRVSRSKAQFGHEVFEPGVRRLFELAVANVSVAIDNAAHAGECATAPPKACSTSTEK